VVPTLRPPTVKESFPFSAEKKPKTGTTIASGSYEQAGGLLLLAAATETSLLT